MRYKIEVQDHAHGGGQITIREVFVTVRNRLELIKTMCLEMGDYPICHAVRVYPRYGLVLATKPAV